MLSPIKDEDGRERMGVLGQLLVGPNHGFVMIYHFRPLSLGDNLPGSTFLLLEATFKLMQLSPSVADKLVLAGHLHCSVLCVQCRWKL